MISSSDPGSPGESPDPRPPGDPCVGADPNVGADPDVGADPGADVDASDEASTVVARFLAQLVELDSDIARLMARKVWLVDQARQWSEASIDAVVSSSFSEGKRAELARRSLTAEIACSSRIPEVTASRLLDESEALVHELSQTRAALAAGAISYRHAQVMCDQSRSLPTEARAPFEEAVLGCASTTTASQFSRAARAERERSHPESMVTRAQKAAEDRHVSFEPDRDGMAWLHHYLPAVDAARIDDTIDQLARGLRAAGDAAGADAVGGCTQAGTRTLAQLRSDVLTDLLLRDPATGEPRPLNPTVMVTVPVLTLLGRSDAPASLDGYGPIDAEVARSLAGHARSFIRILTHPETGAVLSVGRDRYRPPADLKLALQVGDETCRFPGCNRRATRCELDHNRDWQHGGETKATNLAHLCPKHHHLKHETAWSVSIDRNRSLHWVSPAGRKYATHATNAAPPPRPDTYEIDTEDAPF